MYKLWSGKKCGTLGALAALMVLAGQSSRADVSLTTLATFNNANGAGPVGPLVLDAAGNLYGTTKNGGTNNLGTVFQVAAGSHTLNTLASFAGANGQLPEGKIVLDGAGNIYGSTIRGGTGSGTVFEVVAGTNTVTTLVTFNGSNGSGPSGLIADVAGNLYGTTEVGGANGGEGTIFKITSGTHSFSTLATFNSSAINGIIPEELAVDAAGNFFGTTTQGGPVPGGLSNNAAGTVYELAASTNALTTLVSFVTTNGATPKSALIIDGSGNLYGTTTGGGSGGHGTVFEVATGTHTLTTLATFDKTNGDNPYYSLLMDGAGNLFGTTIIGGANSDGTVFEIAAGTHFLTTLATFNGSNGATPLSLIADGTGNLYGVTAGGGSGNGTVFELTGTDFVIVPEPVSLSIICLCATLPLRRRQQRKR